MTLRRAQNKIRYPEAARSMLGYALKLTAPNNVGIKTCLLMTNDHFL